MYFGLKNFVARAVIVLLVFYFGSGIGVFEQGIKGFVFFVFGAPTIVAAFGLEYFFAVPSIQKFFVFSK